MTAHLDYLLAIALELPGSEATEWGGVPTLTVARGFCTLRTWLEGGLWRAEVKICERAIAYPSSPCAPTLARLCAFMGDKPPAAPSPPQSKAVQLALPL